MLTIKDSLRHFSTYSENSKGRAVSNCKARAETLPILESPEDGIQYTSMYEVVSYEFQASFEHFVYSIGTFESW